MTMPSQLNLTARGTRVAMLALAGVAVGLVVLLASSHSTTGHVTIRALSSLTVARDIVAPGCVLPASPDLQPYECGGHYAGAFNQRIPDNTASDPQSGAIVSEMVQSMREFRAGLGDDDGDPAAWIVSQGDPMWRVTSERGQRTISFPMPARVRTAPGSDAPLLVYDPDSVRYGPFTELRAWRAHVDVADHTITTTEYGLFHYGRASNGRPFYGVGTGYGLSWGGLIRTWEVRSGSIDHALRVAAPVDSIAHRLPAISSDCQVTVINNCQGLIAEGLRLQLSPSVNCRSRTVPFSDPGGVDTQFLREICRTLQVYGMIVVDGSGDANLYTLFMEEGSEAGGTADWNDILNRPPNGLWGNIIRDTNADSTGDGVSRNSTTGIPWGQMRVLARSVFGG